MNRCMSGKPVWRSDAFSTEMLLAVPVWLTLLRRPWVAVDATTMSPPRSPGDHLMSNNPAPPDQERASSADIPRRQALGALAAGAGALVAGSAGKGAAASRQTAASPVTSLPAPSAAGIDHVLGLMMANRSFAHYLRWLRGADAPPAGL